MKSKNLLFKSSFIYIIGSFLTAGLAFLTTPIFTRILSVDDYGIVSIFTTWVNLMITIVGLETSSTISIAYVKFKNNEFNSYLSSILLLSTASFSIISFVVFVSRQWIIDSLDITPLLLIVLLIQAFFGYVQQFYNTYLIQAKKPMKSLILSVSFSILSTALSILLVILFKDNKYIGQIIGKAFVVFVYGLVTYILIIQKSKPKINMKYWKFCLRLSIPIIFHLLSATALSQADKIMIQQYVGNQEVGIYSFAYTIATVLSVLWQASNKAWVPWYFEQTKLNNTDLINAYAKQYLSIFSLATIGLMLIVPEITRLLGPINYQGGERITLLVMLGIYFNFLYSFLSNYEFYKEKTKWIATGTIAAALINIALNILLIPTLGSTGAAIATLVAYIMLFVFHSIIATRIEGYNIRYNMIIKNIIFTIIGFSTVNVVLESRLIRGFMILAIISFVFVKLKNNNINLKIKKL